MILSISILIVALGLGYGTALLLRRLDASFIRPIRPWMYCTSILWILMELFFIAVTLQDIGAKALLIGTGIPLIGWAGTTLGLLWSHKVHQTVRSELDRRLSSDPEMADRFYSSRWTKWLMPK